MTAAEETMIAMLTNIARTVADRTGKPQVILKAAGTWMLVAEGAVQPPGAAVVATIGPGTGPGSSRPVPGEPAAPGTKDLGSEAGDRTEGLPGPPARQGTFFEGG